MDNEKHATLPCLADEIHQFLYVDADFFLFGRGWLPICHVVMENLELVSEWNHLYHVYPRVTLNGITEIHAKYSIDT